MRNIIVEVEENELVLTIDLTQDFGPSNSGKTNIVASSEGNITVPDHPDIKFGLNVFKS